MTKRAKRAEASPYQQFTKKNLIHWFFNVFWTGLVCRGQEGLSILVLSNVFQILAISYYVIPNGVKNFFLNNHKIIQRLKVSHAPGR